MKPNFGELSTKMIELLSKRKLIVQKDNIKLTIDILKKTFPKGETDGVLHVIENHDLFLASSNMFDWGWISENEDNLPIYKATDFIIPEKFAVFVDKNNHADVKRILEIDDSLNYENRYYHMPYHSGHNDWSHVQPGYTLLTFDHFKLLFDCGVEKEIEGYLAPMDLYGALVKKGTLFVKNGFYVNSQSYQPKGETQYSSFQIAAEIVETWDPIYKSKEVIIQVGACKIPVHVIPGKRIFAKHGGREIEILIGQLEHLSGEQVVYHMGGVRVVMSNAKFAVTLNNETLKDVTLEEINKIITEYQL
jgi:hypothetical protein